MNYQKLIMSVLILFIVTNCSETNGIFSKTGSGSDPFANISQSSLEYSPVGLTTHESGFSDHIVSTSGGGRRRRSPRRSQRRGQRRGQRRSQRRSQRSQRRSQRRR